MPATVAIDGKVENKYPKILGVQHRSPAGSEEIIKNRNKFVEEFSITKSVLTNYKIELLQNLYPQKLGSGQIDHPELYQTSKLEHVFICSNYSSLPPSGLGMKRYLDLYNQNCLTYIRIFAPGEWQNMRKWLKRRKIISANIYLWLVKAETIENKINGIVLPKLILPIRNPDGSWR